MGRFVFPCHITRPLANRGGDSHTMPHTPFIIADLDGTLLHDAERFEDRALSARTIETVHAVRSRGIPVVVATARPVSTGLSIVQALHADACIYLNGALIDFDPSQSDYASLTGHKPSSPGSLVKNGFDSQRACEVCRAMLSVMPDLEIGIVMDDIRYTNFDVSRYWATQTWQYTDFRDVPHGIATRSSSSHGPNRPICCTSSSRMTSPCMCRKDGCGCSWRHMPTKRMRCKHYATSGGWMHNRPRHSAMTWSISA